MRYLSRLIAVFIISSIVVLIVTGLVSILSPGSLAGEANANTPPTTVPGQPTAPAAHMVLPFAINPSSLAPAAQSLLLDVQPFADIFGVAPIVSAGTPPSNGSPTSVLVRGSAVPVVNGGSAPAVFGGTPAESAALVASSDTASGPDVGVPPGPDTRDRWHAPTATPMPTGSVAQATPTPTHSPPIGATPTRTSVPTSVAHATPTPTAIIRPTAVPSTVPTHAPQPTAVPTNAPQPTAVPQPTDAPTDVPQPTDAPTDVPQPTDAPTDVPQEAPTDAALPL